MFIVSLLWFLGCSAIVEVPVYAVVGRMKLAEAAVAFRYLWLTRLPFGLLLFVLSRAGYHGNGMLIVLGTILVLISGYILSRRSKLTAAPLWTICALSLVIGSYPVSHYDYPTHFYGEGPIRLVG